MISAQSLASFCCSVITSYSIHYTKLYDLNDAEEALRDLDKKLSGRYPLVGVSTVRKDGLEELRRTIFEHSGVLRVYSKQPGKDPDLKMPFLISEGSTVLDLAALIHKDFVEGFKYACIV